MSQKNTTLTPEQLQLAKRWRLVLGQYADNALGQATFSAEELKIERSLDFYIAENTNVEA